MPPVALTLSCLLAIVWPPRLATTVTCQVPPVSRLSGAFINAITLFVECRFASHSGHAHGRHGWHEEGHGHLGTSDWLSVGARQLHADGVRPLAGWGGVGAEINGNSLGWARSSPLPLLHRAEEA